VATGATVVSIIRITASTELRETVELSTVIPLLVNGGIAGTVLAVFLYLVVGGHLIPGHIYQEKREECEELKAALASERARGDAAVAAAATTRDLLLAIGGRRALALEDEE
jgi:hypothetical protein